MPKSESVHESIFLTLYYVTYLTYRSEDLSGLLDGGDLGPAPLLEELYASGIMQRGGGVCSEECGKALTVGERWRAGAVGQLEQVFRGMRNRNVHTYQMHGAELESAELKMCDNITCKKANAQRAKLSSAASITVTFYSKNPNLT